MMRSNASMIFRVCAAILLVVSAANLFINSNETVQVLEAANVQEEDTILKNNTDPTDEGIHVFRVFNPFVMMNKGKHDKSSEEGKEANQTSLFINSNETAQVQQAENVQQEETIFKINTDPTDERIHLIHVFNPFVMMKKKVKHDNSSDEGEEASQTSLFDLLGVEQWLTIQSIQRALPRLNNSAMTVDVVCTMFQEDAIHLSNRDLPCRIVLLERSTAIEYPHLKPPKQLPFLQEILDISTSAYTNNNDTTTISTTETDTKSDTNTTGRKTKNEKKQFYWMYTNSDIGISRDYYNDLLPLLQKHDAFTINRVTLKRFPNMTDILTKENSTAWLEYVDNAIQNGTKHPGFDTFVLHSDVLQRISFGDFFTGHPPWGSNMHHFLRIMADSYRNVQANPQGTFHVGDDMSWKVKEKVTLTTQQKALINHCPVKPGFWTTYSAQGAINCGKWFQFKMYNSSRILERVPAVAVKSGYEDIFLQHNKKRQVMRYSSYLGQPSIIWKQKKKPGKGANKQAT